MESNETGKTNTVKKKKHEIRCGVCGSIAGKSGKDGAEFICPKCGKMLIPKRGKIKCRCGYEKSLEKEDIEEQYTMEGEKNPEMKVIVTDKAKGEQTLDDALELGAEDFAEEDEAYVISTAPNDVTAVREGLEAAGYNVLSAESEMVPSNYVTVNGEEEQKLMRRLLEMLDDDDDVINVYHNLENEDEIME